MKHSFSFSGHSSAAVCKSAVFDVVVIGGGTAGCIVASHLAERRISTLLVERGPLPTAYASLMTRMPGSRLLHPDLFVQQNLVRRGSLTVSENGRRCIEDFFRHINQSERQTGVKTMQVPHVDSPSVLGGYCVTGSLAWQHPFPGECEEWALNPVNGIRDTLSRMERHLSPASESESDVVRPTAVLTRSVFSSQLYRSINEQALEDGFTIVPDYGGTPRARNNKGYFGRADLRIGTEGNVTTTATQYLKRAMRDPLMSRYLTVLTHHEAVGLNITSGAYGASSVRVCPVQGSSQGTNTNFHDIPCGRVVLAAGAIESPLLLLRSGIGCAQMLRTSNIDVRVDLPDVGRNWFDHVEIPVVIPITRPVTIDALYRSSLVQVLSQLEWYFRQEGWLMSDTSDFMAFMNPDRNATQSSALDSRMSDATLTARDHEVLVPNLAWNIQPFGSYDPTPNASMLSEIQQQEPHALTVRVRLVRPRSRGVIALGQNSGDPPKLQFDLLQNTADGALLKEAIHRVRSFFTSQRLMKAFGVKENAISVQGIRLLGQAGGTCRMMSAEEAAVPPSREEGSFSTGHRAPQGSNLSTCGVVKEDFSVNGLENVSICDSSVLPGPFSSGTYSSTWALAEIFSRHQ